jgi:hypothetical protein
VPEIFAGANITGSAAEKLDRRWLAFEKDRPYLAASAFRFVDELPAEELATLWSQVHSDALPVAVDKRQKDLVLMELPQRIQQDANGGDDKGIAKHSWAEGIGTQFWERLRWRATFGRSSTPAQAGSLIQRFSIHPSTSTTPPHTFPRILH